MLTLIMLLRFALFFACTIQHTHYLLVMAMIDADDGYDS